MANLVAIEGIDGSGKGTQAQRLRERLERSGRRVRLVSFPRYAETFFGRAVGDFLNGRFGNLADVHPFLVSLLFAGDRFQSRDLLTEALTTCDVVVLDRYVASNVAHQAAKLDGAARESLVREIEELEYAVFGIPRPDLSILLDLSVPHAQALIARKPPRDYTRRPADIQEADAEYLARVRDLYRQLAQREAGWTTILCDRDGSIRSIDEVSDEIWRTVTTRLPRIFA